MIKVMTPEELAQDKTAIRVVVGFDRDKQQEIVQFVKLTPEGFVDFVQNTVGRFDYHQAAEWIASVEKSKMGIASPIYHEIKTETSTS